jgi:hypothetical protein
VERMVQGQTPGRTRPTPRSHASMNYVKTQPRSTLTIDIDTDAHISSDFLLLPYDIDKARLGRLSQESVFNAPGVDGLQTARKR